MRFLNVLLLALWLTAACGDSVQRGDDAVEQTDSPWSMGDVRVPTRDGVDLLTDIYLPVGDGPFPTVLTRVPYGKRSGYVFLPAIGQFWVRHGYVYVAQDVRGRFGSEGSFAPYAPNDQEGLDAYDTIEWITRQPWSDRNVGMMGESYYGYTSLVGTRNGHPALKAISPGNITMAREKQVLDGAYPLQASGLWTLNMDDIEDGEYQDLSNMDLMHVPLITMGEAHGLRDNLWRDRVGGYLDRSEDWREQLHERYAQVRVPALHFGGWYDSFTRGSIAIWEGVSKHSSDERARDMQWLVMGPWDHNAMSVHLSGAPGLTQIGRVPIGDSSVTTYEELLVEFFDHTLRGRDNALSNGPRVRYFAIGDNEWRSSSQWPPPAVQMTPLYLRANAAATRGAETGRLETTAPGNEPPDTYRYDPNDPVTISSQTDIWGKASALPDRTELLERADVLTYTTAPFDEALEITGPITVNLFASSTAPDTDFTAALVDVFPDGYSLMIQEGILRASFRDREALPSPIVPGEVYLFPIDLWAPSYVVPAGHRLRVEISSSNFPRFARNLNTGHEFGMSDEIAIADQTVYHTEQHPSHVLLPVVPR